MPLPPQVEWCAECYSHDIRRVASVHVGGEALCPEHSKGLDPDPEPVTPTTVEHAIVPRKLGRPPKKEKPVDREPLAIELVETAPAVKNVERISQIRIALPSGAGELTLRFEGKLFELTRADRHFIFTLTDRMREYAEGTKEQRPKGMQEGEKLYSVRLPLSVLKDVYENCVEGEDEAAVMAAWFRDDPAVKP